MDAPAFPLTPEQQQIVRHDHGPALVFAVAGAGKTTAMVHRIERLVREGLFPPAQILATSFSRASVNDIRAALGAWPHCERVQVSTLHAVGLSILRRAEARGYVAPAAEYGDVAERVLFATLAHARRMDVHYRLDLEDLDQEDFLTYVGACKGNLRYADLEAAGLPAAARAVAAQAERLKETPWYLDLYRLFEQVRGQMRFVTFDDMLTTGWELLVRFPDLLAEVQARFQCVLVDEFQDINHVQSELLDLLTALHRNYMVIGDDDQTIYEWRGASPRFILGFRERYDARTYLISDNFRSQAAHVVLANRVIRHNRERAAKHLSLTQGFDGALHVHRMADAEAMGQHVAEVIAAARADGLAPDQVAVLVRLYAQTPPIEQALIQQQIPYRVVGSEPFYQRAELAVLLRYLSLAAFEEPLRRGVRLTPGQAASFQRWWFSLYNKPNRYLARPLAEQVARLVTAEGLPLADALRRVAGEAPAGTAWKMEDLADQVEWLVSVQASTPADVVLGQLADKLEYRAYLRASSPVSGEGKAASVDALLRYTRGRGTPVALLEHLRGLAMEQAAGRRRDPRELVSILSIHRAKGLEWPLVIVPECNQGVLPFHADADGGAGAAGLEEERRLFYVAVTRARRHLHLYTLQTAPMSQFLKEGAYRKTLEAVEAVRGALGRGEACTPEDLLALARHTGRLRLERFLTDWWPAPEAVRRTLAQRVQALFHVAEQGGLCDRLGLRLRDRAFWQQLAPLDAPPAEEAFDLEALLPETPARYETGHQIEHPTFGAGEVVQVSGPEGDQRVLVRFVEAGEKKLAARVAGLRLREG